MARFRCICGLPLLLVFFTTPVFAQSGADYSAWVEWCISQGGTPNGDASNPVCTPGTAPPVYQTPQVNTGPSQYELDQQARQRAVEREQQERELRRQEEARRVAAEAARQAEFIQGRDAAVTGLKGLAGGTATGLKGLGESAAAAPRLKGLDDAGPCPPSQDASVVDLCFRDGKSGSSETAAKNTDPKAAAVIESMNAVAKRQGWSADELARLDNALNALGGDGIVATKEDIRETWQDIQARGRNGELAQKASAGDGPGLYGAGTQGFNDCAIFALATAAALPYGVAATHAAELIGQAEWRQAEERKNPQGTLEQVGLNGGEVIMLAEAFGQAEVIDSSKFAKTLKEGRAVMINVIPKGGVGGHEVVLSKTFQHDGETWYEIVDSNQGPLERSYLSAGELDVILQENGVAFRPEPGTTAKLLRAE